MNNSFTFVKFRRKRSCWTSMFTYVLNHTRLLIISIILIPFIYFTLISDFSFRIFLKSSTVVQGINNLNHPTLKSAVLSITFKELWNLKAFSFSLFVFLHILFCLFLYWLIHIILLLKIHQNSELLIQKREQDSIPRNKFLIHNIIEFFVLLHIGAIFSSFLTDFYPFITSGDRTCHLSWFFASTSVFSLIIISALPYSRSKQRALYFVIHQISNIALNFTLPLLESHLEAMIDDSGENQRDTYSLQITTGLANLMFQIIFFAFLLYVFMQLVWVFIYEYIICSKYAEMLENMLDNITEHKEYAFCSAFVENLKNPKKIQILTSNLQIQSLEKHIVESVIEDLKDQEGSDACENPIKIKSESEQMTTEFLYLNKFLQEIVISNFSQIKPNDEESYLSKKEKLFEECEFPKLLKNILEQITKKDNNLVKDFQDLETKTIFDCESKDGFLFKLIVKIMAKSNQVLLIFNFLPNEDGTSKKLIFSRRDSSGSLNILSRIKIAISRQNSNQPPSFKNEDFKSSEENRENANFFNIRSETEKFAKIQRKQKQNYERLNPVGSDFLKSLKESVGELEEMEESKIKERQPSVTICGSIPPPKETTNPSAKMVKYKFQSNHNWKKFLSLHEPEESPLHNEQIDPHSGPRESNEAMYRPAHTSSKLSGLSLHKKLSSSKILYSRILHNINVSAISASSNNEYNEADRKNSKFQEIIENLKRELKSNQIYLNMIIHDLRNPVLSLENALDTIVQILRLDPKMGKSGMKNSIFESSPPAKTNESLCIERTPHKGSLGEKINLKSLTTFTPRGVSEKHKKTRKTVSGRSSLLYSIKSLAQDSRFFTISQKHEDLQSNFLRNRHVSAFKYEDSDSPGLYFTESDNRPTEELRKPRKEESYLTPSVKEQLYVIVKVAKLCSFVLTNLINDLLDSAKINKNTFKLCKENTNLLELVSNTRQILLFQAKLKTIKLILDIGTPSDRTFLDRVYIDENRVRQVIINLISNALKFTLKNGKITIKLRVEEKPGSSPASDSLEKIEPRSRVNVPVKVLCQISDTGVGIEPCNIGKLFTDFTTLDEHSKINHAGTGLGLSICKKIIQKMGGTIDVQSTPGQGSCFTFSFPTSYNHQNLFKEILNESNTSDNTLNLPRYYDGTGTPNSLPKSRVDSFRSTKSPCTPLGTIKEGLLDKQFLRTKKRNSSTFRRCKVYHKKTSLNLQEGIFSEETGSHLERSMQEIQEMRDTPDRSRFEETQGESDKEKEETKNERSEERVNSERNKMKVQTNNLRNKLFTFCKKESFKRIGKYNKRVLVVDDSDMIRLLTVNIVKPKVLLVDDTDNGYLFI